MSVDEWMRKKRRDEVGLRENLVWYFKNICVGFRKFIGGI